MTKFEKFKADMGDEYDKKVKEIARSRNVQTSTKVCKSCNQLEFDHKPGSCMRSSAAVTTQYTSGELEDISKDIMKDVVKAIVEEEKLKLVQENQQVEASKFFVGGDDGSLAKKCKE